MTARILVPYDGSNSSREALAYAAELFPDGEFVALTVVDVSSLPFIPNAAGSGPTKKVQGVLSEPAEQLATAERIAAAHGVDLETRTRVGSPAQEIVEFAESQEIDHVVVGSRGRSGVTRFLLGSVAEVVVRHSPVPVTVVR